MKILDVLFYYYYLIYTKKIATTTPIETAIFCLGASFGFELLCIIDFIITFFCLEIREISYLIGLFPIVTLYFLYWRTGRYKKVLKQKPKFFNSHKKTKVIVGIFFIFTASSLVWQPILIKYIRDEKIDCKQRIVVEDVVKEKIISLFSE